MKCYQATGILFAKYNQSVLMRYFSLPASQHFLLTASWRGITEIFINQGQQRRDEAGLKGMRYPRRSHLHRPGPSVPGPRLLQSWSIWGCWVWFGYFYVCVLFFFFSSLSLLFYLFFFLFVFFCVVFWFYFSFLVPRFYEHGNK